MKKFFLISSVMLVGALTCTSCSSCSPQGSSRTTQMRQPMQDKPHDKSGQGCGKPCAPCDTCPPKPCAPSSPCDGVSANPMKSSSEQTSANANAQKSPSLNVQSERKAEKQKPALSEAPQKETLPIVKEDKRENANEASKTSQIEVKKSDDSLSFVKKEASDATTLEQTSGK